MRDITLSIAVPETQLGNYTVKLVSIAEDGTTRILVKQTQRILAARPGESFNSFEFGSEGLTLISASKTKGTATFVLRGAVYH